MIFRNTLLASLAALAALIGLSLLLGSQARGQGLQIPEMVEAKAYSNLMSEASLRSYLSALAADSMEGRETGSFGQKKAARYIATQFAVLGLAKPFMDGQEASYLQKFKVYRSKMSSAVMGIKGKSFTPGADFLPVAPYPKALEQRKIDVVFGGFGLQDGLSNSSQAPKYVRNKAVILLQASGNLGNTEGRGGARRTAQDLQVKAKEYIALGAKMVFMAVPFTKDAKKQISGSWQRLRTGNMALNPTDKFENEEAFALISFATAGIMLGTDSAALMRYYQPIPTDEKLQKEYRRTLPKIKGQTLTLGWRPETDTLTTENVGGYIKGTTHADETVVMTAHYDHLGIIDGEIYNGADDDGSGTASVIEMARTFAQAKTDGKGPQRNVLFLLFTGEEKGLLGSEFYAENPAFPLLKTSIDINTDMIGRIDKGHEGKPNYVYSIGADKISKELFIASEAINTADQGLVLDYAYNDENHPEQLYYRSDHYNFAKKGVPVIFLFTGLHPDYHQPTDDIEKIDFPRMIKISRFIFQTAWVSANRASLWARVK